ncbi:PP2C family protein-serine/threonine phosphatase [Agarivorans litoreus]|uniref:PP2C family protein-serine/threonine phosphatase n=1 Tax=Agarivorans litoreus TaxID=1510455 RepID=UPI001FE26D2D|nr:protein phosphatase 2C domain-containing protein [Agarivorans litoreus]
MVASPTLMDGFFVSFAQTHPGKVRPYNEDAVLDLREEGVWVVADGMGGHAAGDVASQIVIDSVKQCVEQTPAASLSIDCLRKALLQANQQIINFSQQHLDGKTAGSTAVLLHVRDGFYHCLWVGDSRIYLMRQNHLQRKTRDHSQVMDMVEQGLIPESEAEDHPLSNVITRAIGVSDELTVDQNSGQLLPGDQFLLCSDGLTKELNDTDLAMCMQANSVSDIGLALMHSALVKGASDNVSCVLVKVSQSDADSEEEHCDDTVPVFFNRRNSVRG